MAKHTFADGTTIRPKVTLTDPDTGNLLDPTGLTVRIRRPDASFVLYTYGSDAALERLSTGVYRFDLPLALKGTYKWKWLASTATKSIAIYEEADSEGEAGF
jgi:hypothetical protein